MGTKMGPAIACLTMGYFEERILEDFSGTPPVLYKRYIDDIVGVAKGPKREVEKFVEFVGSYCPFLKFTHEISPSSVTFLDVSLSIEHHELSSDIHFKPTDSHNYLLYSSSHPQSCIKSIPYSQLLRARRICSDGIKFEDACSQIEGFFEARMYPPEVVNAAKRHVSRVDRDAVLRSSTSDDTKDVIPCVLPFHPSIYPVRKVIFKHFETLMTDPTTKGIFPNLPTTAFKRENNLSNHL